MLGSSTPDGLAPIDPLALIVFVCTIGGLAMVWGLVNLVVLLRVWPEGESNEKMDRVFEVHRKVLRGAIDLLKLNLLVGIVAAIAFFLLIMVRMLSLRAQSSTSIRSPTVWPFWPESSTPSSLPLPQPLSTA